MSRRCDYELDNLPVDEPCTGEVRSYTNAQGIVYSACPKHSLDTKTPDEMWDEAYRRGWADREKEPPYMDEKQYWRGRTVERAAIVAWLRSIAWKDTSSSRRIQALCDMIEHGEHRGSE